MSKPGECFIYKVYFIGRRNTDIGTVYPIDEIVEYDLEVSENKILLDLYEKYEHISQLQVRRI